MSGYTPDNPPGGTELQRKYPGSADLHAKVLMAVQYHRKLGDEKTAAAYELLADIALAWFGKTGKDPGQILKDGLHKMQGDPDDAPAV